mmetsp:Transcript_14682/g.31735  ORF Transcript_14682/g.31735 Transcript_14682/m.31735 type:complete len:374 (-) Transcript_14682:78-1199(-)|eukprot:CAMPEP_0206445600 /NCGR_PEP_ID=MMETSP0324_2-20121206/15618_1 /ASSEMBLY_ACC=CAM_ASM_000836 /TAXON_ID=2866 /ORGANISM="Crypthecodinium cohnii, Strain Seligo" /LENGTH=373 /DNA_ID=CAMNT_0053913873 /DNA_START=195 /DNA_END=1316 /DNA_ORIENTATION=+
MSGQVQMTSLDVGALCLHDAQLDYYGKRAAVVCGAPVQPDDTSGLPEGDFSVHIWDVTEGQQKPIAQLKGHEGPVWKVAWAHPKFGSLLATCSYDMKVIIWKEVNGQWTKAYVDSSHTASVNEIEFCPFEHGLRLACASSDGMVSVLTYEPQQALWRRSVFQAHQCGAQSVSWAPVCQRDLGHGPPAIRIATGGCDNSVSVWKCEAEVWSQEMPALMPGHTDWVRKVAWRPDGTSTIASGGWDKQVVIWKQEMEGHPWRQLTKLPMAGKVEGLAWSVTGSLLAVSYDSGDVTLYRESDDGDAWEEIGKCNEKGYTDIPRANAAVNAISHSPPAADGFAAQNAVNAAFDQAPPGPDAAAQQAQQQSVLESFGMM